MKRLLIATALTGCLLSGAAFADDDRKDYWKDRKEAQKEWDKDRREAHKEWEKDRREAIKEDRKFEREMEKERREDYRRWARGERLPRDYMYDRYYVRDYRAYDLAPPPNGYMWVRPYENDDTYYMVQLATGLISQIFGR